MTRRLKEFTCTRCGVAFKVPQKTAKYCSRRCAALHTGTARGRQLRRADPFCSVEGCDREAHTTLDGHGQLCLMHYKRWRRHGSVRAIRNRRPHGMPIEDWFWQHVEKTDACWIWKGNVLHKKGGYGTLWHPGLKQKIRVHHFLVGKPRTGCEWHHRCDNVLCVRPDHLQHLTKTEHRKHHATAPSLA